MSEWISVMDQLPDLTHYQPNWGRHSDMVLCWLCGICAIGSYHDRTTGPHKGMRGWDFVGNDVKHRPDQRVTHWMPLPEPPKESV